MAPGPLTPVDQKFVGFLRATLGKMAGTGVIGMELIDLDFWSAWPRRFYNIRTYDLTKENFEVPEGILNSLGQNTSAMMHQPEYEEPFMEYQQQQQPQPQQQQQQQQRPQPDPCEKQQQQQQWWEQEPEPQPPPQPQPQPPPQPQQKQIDSKSTRKVKNDTKIIIICLHIANSCAFFFSIQQRGNTDSVNKKSTAPAGTSKKSRLESSAASETPTPSMEEGVVYHVNLGLFHSLLEAAKITARMRRMKG